MSNKRPYAQISQSSSQGMDVAPYSSSRSTKRFKRAGYKTLPVNDKLKKYVQRAISKRTENKKYVAYAANNSIFTAGPTSAPSGINLLPVIAQGLGQAGRLGNEISIRKAVLKIRFNPKPNTNVSPLPLILKCWLCSYKIENASALALADYSNFFDTGNSSIGFQNNTLDLVLPVNTDEWTLYKTWEIKLGVSGVSAGYTSAANVFDNSPFSDGFVIDYADKLKSALKYDDSVNTCTNRNMFLIIQAVAADGSGPAEGLAIAEYHYTLNISYEDA